MLLTWEASSSPQLFSCKHNEDTYNAAVSIIWIIITDYWSDENIDQVLDTMQWMFRVQTELVDWIPMAGSRLVWRREEKHHVYQYFLQDAKRSSHRTKTLLQKPLSVGYIVQCPAYTVYVLHTNSSLLRSITFIGKLNYIWSFRDFLHLLLSLYPAKLSEGIFLYYWDMRGSGALSIFFLLM